MSPQPYEARVGRNFVHTAVGMILFQGLTFIAGIVMARSISPASVGRFQLLNTISVFAGLLVRLGLDEGLAYKLPEYRMHQPQKTRALVLYVFVLTVLLSIALGAAFYVFADSLHTHVFTLPSFDTDLRLLIWLLPLSIALQIALASLRSLGRTDLRAFVFYYLVGASFLLLLGVFASDGLSLEESYLARFLSYGLGVLVAIYLSIRHLPRGGGHLAREEIRELHAFSGVLIFVWMFAYIVEQPLVDLVIVARVASADDVGVYAVAARVGSLVAIGMTAMSLVLGPAFADAVAAKDGARINAQYKRASHWLAILGLFSGLGVILFRSELLKLFGHQYAHGRLVLVVFAACHIVVSQLGVNTPALVAAKLGRIELLLTGIGSLMMTILGAILGIAFGMLGVAIATSVSIVVLSVARKVVVTRRVLQRFEFEHYRFWLPAAAAFAGCFVLKEVVLGSSLHTLVFLGTLYVAAFAYAIHLFARPAEVQPR